MFYLQQVMLAVPHCPSHTVWNLCCARISLGIDKVLKPVSFKNLNLYKDNWNL